MTPRTPGYVGSEVGEHTALLGEERRDSGEAEAGTSNPKGELAPLTPMFPYQASRADSSARPWQLVAVPMRLEPTHVECE